MEKKRFFITLFIILALTTPVFAKWTQKEFNSHYPDMEFSVWTDEEYGVQYVVCKSIQGIGICPRYTQSGTMVHEPAKE